jgi:Flp pilus assembly protein TadG
MRRGKGHEMPRNLLKICQAMSIIRKRRPASTNAGESNQRSRLMQGVPIPGILAPRWQRKFMAFAEDKRGIAAVEFAMIAMPFFLLIFSLLEVCVIFIMTSVLEHAASEAARQIRTGQFQTSASPLTEDDFKQDICDELFGLMTCGEKLELDVATFSSFSGTSAPAPTFDSGTGDLDDSGFGFSPGSQNEIVVVRVFYEWDLIVPVLSKPLANMGTSNRRLLQATVAFRNEPFGS